MPAQIGYAGSNDLLEETPAMNKPTKMADMKPAGMSPDEWEARVNLAAVYRLLAVIEDAGCARLDSVHA